MRDMMAPLKGFFRPHHPEKYKGNPAQIIYRSGWELRFMAFLDKNKDVILWASEEIRIPYRSPIDNIVHWYYPDMWVKFRDKDGHIKTAIYEIKPKEQCSPPPRQNKKTKKYIREVMTWGINEAKWKAASEYCKDRKWEFKLLTEREIYGR